MRRAPARDGPGLGLRSTPSANILFETGHLDQVIGESVAVVRIVVFAHRVAGRVDGVRIVIVAMLDNVVGDLARAVEDEAGRLCCISKYRRISFGKD